MQETTLNAPDLHQEKTPLILWQESVGKIYKLVIRAYGVRNVTYTKIKTVKEAETPGQFDIEVSCAEFTARVLNSKRAHSSGCKEGTIHQDEESILTPGSFGEECEQEEFEKVSAAILVHATMNLDLVMQHNPEENALEVPIDLPHLKITEMEASLLRNSPFLVRDVYLITTNSLKAAFESINSELHRAARNSRLTDVADPVYVEQKNDAVTSLRTRLSEAMEVLNARTNTAPAVAACNQIAPGQKRVTPVLPTTETDTSDEPAPQESKPAVLPVRRLGLSPLEKRNNIALALVGKTSAATLSWEQQNPSKAGVVFRIGKECGMLEFVRWAHISARTVSDQETSGKEIRGYFGDDASYRGPDQDGVYPLLKIAS